MRREKERGEEQKWYCKLVPVGALEFTFANQQCRTGFHGMVEARCFVCILNMANNQLPFKHYKTKFNYIETKLNWTAASRHGRQNHFSQMSLTY